MSGWRPIGATGWSSGWALRTTSPPWPFSSSRMRPGYITGQTYLIDGGATAHQPWYSLSHITHPKGIESDGLPGAMIART